MIVMMVVMMVVMMMTTTNSGLLITRRNQSGLEADYHLHTIQLRSIKNTIHSGSSPFFSTLIMIWTPIFPAYNSIRIFATFSTLILIGLILFSGWFLNSSQLIAIFNFRITAYYTINNVIPWSNNTFIKL